MDEDVENRAVELEIRGKKRTFDVDDPALPNWVDEHALESGDFPYKKKLKEEDYLEELEKLQIELVKVQFWLQATGKRVMALFEGRDAAGKGGAISASSAHMNPRLARVVALTKPTEREQGQWYFQRYVAQFPTAGEFVLFDRSWYNRAGVEPVMSCKFIAISLLSIGLAGSALAQTAGGADANGRLSVAPVIAGSGSSGAGSGGAGSAGTGSVGGGATGTGSVGTGSVGTDSGTTGSTTGNGGVNLNSGRSTINPGGVNPNLQQTPGCTSGSANTGSLGEA